MAKRKRLETPTAAELNRLEQEVAARPTARPSASAAPIAQVAAEAAQAWDAADADTRAAAAKAQADAERLRQAEVDGRLLAEIPLAEIDADDMVRDRAQLDPDEMRELRDSILANGLRLPIEVYELVEPRGEMRYGVLSGYRRLKAMQEIWDGTELTKFSTIRAIIRQPASVPAAFAAMVEENEVRANLTPFERGRIAVIAAQSGVFANVEAAVDGLFASASKAKRSKVRSFALVFEELGDMLRFPEALSERQGLRLAAALRAGKDDAARLALEAAGHAISAEAEWAALEHIVAEAERAPRDAKRGGRPRAQPAAPDWSGAPEFTLSNGVRLRRERGADGWIIRLEGGDVPEDVVHAIMVSARNLLGS
ncbi:MAG: ParB N-terminal domain-containing protein [Pseudomonadota bacterium]